MRPKALSGLLCVVAIGTAGCGASADRDVAGATADRAFIAELTELLRQGIEIAALAEGAGQSRFVRSLGSEIARRQSEQIHELQGIDDEIGLTGAPNGEPAARPSGLARLDRATDFDRTFLKVMTSHHLVAIERAERELRANGDSELTRLAQAVAQTARADIEEMSAYRQTRFGRRAQRSGAARTGARSAP